MDDNPSEMEPMSDCDGFRLSAYLLGNEGKTIKSNSDGGLSEACCGIRFLILNIWTLQYFFLPFQCSHFLYLIWNLTYTGIWCPRSYLCSVGL